MNNMQIGSGLITSDGFSARSGTGYKLRNSLQGCRPGGWGGIFVDRFGYTAHASGHDLTFGTRWKVTPNGGADYVLDAGNNGYLISSVSGPAGFIPSCSNIPVLQNQFSSCIVSVNGTQLHPAAGTPQISGGPAVMRDSTGQSGYSVRCGNGFWDDLSDFRHAFVVAIDGTDNTNLTYKMLTGGSGFNSDGFRVDPAEIWLQAFVTVVGGNTYVQLKLFLDPERSGLTMVSAPVLDYTFNTTGGYRHDGYFGLAPTNASKISNFIGGSL